MRRLRISGFMLAVIWLAVLLVQPGMAQAEETETIQRVSVNIVTSPPAPPGIARRIEASVKTVGERLLVGRDQALVAATPQLYEALVQDVLDRVLAGYTIERTTITSGRTSMITVVLEPWGERVRNVHVQIDFSAADAKFVPLLRQELGDLETNIKGILLGLPIDSLDWADTVAKNSIRDLVETRLPEYRASVDITPGETTEVTLVFSPVGAVVREAVVALRSDSMPNLLLYEMRPTVEAFAKALRGLPVEFVTRKQLVLTKELEQLAATHPYTRSYDLHIRAELLPGPDTAIRLQAESRKYRVNAEARLDMGSDNANTSGLLHVGKFFSPKDELFTEVKLITNSMKWKFSPGWGRRIGTNTVVGLRFNITDSINYAWLEHHFDNTWLLKVERSSKDDDNEIALRYKLHDFLSAELVHRENENFVRIVGHL